MSSPNPTTLSLNPKPQNHDAAKEDLWEQALNTLSEEDRKQYVDSSDSPREVLQKVHEATKNTGKDCVAKGWRVYRKKNGDEVKLRHVLEKLSKWVETAIKVVDFGVSFDQSGHSALPWGIVKFIVTTGKSNIDVFSDVIEGVESVSSLITRYTIVENLYLRGSREPTIRLRQAITEVYAEILVYLARAKSFLCGGSIKQIGRGLIESARKHYDKTKISEAEVQRCMQLVDADDHRETAEREIEHYDSLRDMLLALNEPITRMTCQWDDFQDHLNSEKRKEVFRWMSTIEYKSHHEDLSKGLLPNSGQWLFDNDHFIEWGQSSVSSILWLHGIPGSGKTRLVSRIINVMLGDGISGPTAFFYCARSTAEPERGRPAEILGAILRQLSSSKPDKPIRGPVANEYEIRRKKADEDCSRVRKLSVEDCTRLILELTKENPATIIIDALDECDEETRHELLEALDMVISSSRELVRVLVSSRDDVDIALHLKSCKNISISADCNGADIARFVVSEVKRLISKKLLLDGIVTKKLRDKLISTLTSGAQGMFRWVAMSLETLQQIKFRPDFERALGQLPSKLSGLYDIVHSQIDKTGSYGRDTAIRTLKWLLCAQRVLTARELIAAIDIPVGEIDDIDSVYDSDEDCIGGNSDQDLIDEGSLETFNKVDSLETLSTECSDEDESDISIKPKSSSTLSWSRSDEIRKNEIIRSCRNLVAIDAQHAHFRFAHQSVREYLLTRQEYTTETQHTLAAERCLDVYLTEAWPDLVNPKFMQRNAHLKKYSRFYWPVHYKYVENTRSSQLLRKMSKFMTQGSTTSPAYLEWVSDFDSYSKHKHKWHLEEDLGDKHSKDGLGPRLVIASSEPKTYLSALCAFGFSSLLKDQELSIDDCNQQISPGENRKWTFVHECYSLLSVASEGGHNQTVEMLLDRGADINAQTNGWSALHFASAKGHESVVNILLGKGTQVDLQDQYGTTALLLASNIGHVSIARSLLEKGADADHECYEKYKNPLKGAAIYGHYPIVQLLLLHGADVNAQSGGNLASALHLASEKGHGSIVQILLEHGADTNARDKNGVNALHNASRKDHKFSVRKLLEYGTDINARDKYGFSALHYASECGHETSAQILLEHGADVNARDKYGDSALHKASREGHESLMQKLLDHGADVNIRDEYGFTALHSISRRGIHESVMKILLEHGADVNARDKYGDSALHKASREGHESLMKILLEHGADVNARDENGCNALHFVSFRAIKAVRLLLSYGADVNARNKKGESVMDWARRPVLCDGNYAISSSPDIVQLLLDHGAIDTPPVSEDDSGRVQEVVPEDSGTEEDGIED